MLFGLFGGEKKRKAEFLTAARSGDVGKLTALLDKGIDINTADESSGDTALILAVVGGHLAAVKALLARKPDLDRQDSNGQTALFLAVTAGTHAEAIVRMLCEAGANVRLGPTLGDNAGATPLMLAVFVNAVEIAKVLLAGGSQTDTRISGGNTLMHASAMKAEFSMTMLLAEAGVPVDATNDRQQTPLHAAANVCNAHAAIVLLGRGANIEARDNEGNTPLMHAVLQNQVPMVKLLLERKADANIVVGGGASAINPLYVSALAGNNDILKLLIGAGVDVEAPVGEKAPVIELAKVAKLSGTVRILSNAIKKQKEARGEVDESAAEAKPTGEKSARRGARKIQLGLWCPSIRYSEEEHGQHLPADFKKAKNAWVKSGNDTESPHYQEAAKLLAKWFECGFAVRFGLSMNWSVTADNEMGDVTDVNTKDSSDPIEQIFKKIPVLKRMAVAAIDFRGSASSDRLKPNEKLLRSPDLGLIAVFDAELNNGFESVEAFAAWMRENGGPVAECFTLNIKDKAIETTVTDDDGETYTTTSASWSGGDFYIEVGEPDATDVLLRHLTENIRNELRTPLLLGEGVSPLKPLFLRADEAAIVSQLDGGLDVNTRIDDQPLLMYALMIAVTAGQWFDHDELRDELNARFSTVETYVSTMKQIALRLLERGADVNVPCGHLSIVGIATTLNDPQLLDRCLAQAATVNDINSTPFLLAAERGDVDSLRVFLGRDVRINKREFLHGTTPLMLAAQGEGGEEGPPLQGEAAIRQEAAVAFLLDNGAEIDAASDMGDTAIGNAVRRGHAGIVRLLLARGAKTREALPRGQRLFDLAKQRGHLEVAAMLESHSGG
jgi:ankyrin repeat protein